MSYNKKALKLHKKNKGKIEIKSKVSLKTKNDLSIAYTPGVGAVSMAISKNKKNSWELTNRANQVAIICDGTAVLGLGDIGPEAAMPVMEGKAVIFKEFAGIDAIPLCINTTNTEKIIEFCKLIEPSFAGINLEDISSPRCFEILSRLEKELDIPVFHDDQDGTAIVTLAALINACRLTGKVLRDLKIVLNGGGAAGISISRLLLNQGVKNIILVDSRGIIYKGRRNINPIKAEIAKVTNRHKLKGDLSDAMVGTDVFIGVSKGNLVNAQMIKSMNDDPIVLALANPIPEIMPDIAKIAGASIVGTGRSDFPNQINNALVFPGLFLGLLKGKICRITTKIKVKAAIALAYSIKPSKNKILPLLTDKKVVRAIAKVVSKNVN